MRNYLTKISLVQLLAVFILTGVLSDAQAQVEMFKLQLDLDVNQTKLIVNSVGRCSSDNHPGCIEVGHKKKAIIDFVFIEDKKCNRNDDAIWELSAVYLGGKNSLKKPKKNKWGGLDAEIEADFNVADPVSGLLNGESGSNANKIIISDDNEYAYDIWYKVTAVCVNNSGLVLATIETDPRLRNGGSQ